MRIIARVAPAAGLVAVMLGVAACGISSSSSSSSSSTDAGKGSGDKAALTISEIFDNTYFQTFFLKVLQSGSGFAAFWVVVNGYHRVFINWLITIQR